MTETEFILSRIIEREGNCMGIACEDCPLGVGVRLSCDTYNDPGTYITAKNMLGILNSSLLFELLL